MPQKPADTDQPRPVGLILTRRPGELIVLELPAHLDNHRVQIACIRVDGKQVKIAIDCPRDWNIYRGEIRGEFLASHAGTPKIDLDDEDEPDTDAESEDKPRGRQVIIRTRPRRWRTKP